MANGLTADIGAQLSRGANTFGQLQQQQLQRQQFEAQQQQAQAALDKQARLQGILGRLGGNQPQQAPQQALGGQPQALPQLGQQQAPALLGAQQVPGAQPPQLGAQQAPQIPFGRAKAMAELAIQFPEKFEQISTNLGLITQNLKDDAANFAFRLRNTPSNQRPAMIDQREAEVRARGGDPTHTISLRGMPEEAQNQALEIVEMAALSGIQRQEVAEGTRAFGLDEKKFALDQTKVFSDIADKKQTQARLTKKASDAAAAGVTIDAKGRQAINKDVTGLIKDTVASVTAARSLEALQKTGTPAAQLAGIFKFMKSLDPTSVVREGEQNMARSVGGPMDRFVGAINQARGEGGLTQRAFRDMVATAKSIANSDIGSAETSVGGFLNTFEQTIPETFKASLLKRLPTPFVVPTGPKEAPDTVGTAVVSPATAGQPITVGRFSVTEFK